MRRSVSTLGSLGSLALGVRALGLQARDNGVQGTVEVPLTRMNNPLFYAINLTVGTPPQQMACTIDTGSSDLWVPDITAQMCSTGECIVGGLDPSKSSSITQGTPYNLSYGTGEYSGNLLNETVTIGGVTIQDQTLAVMTATDPNGGFIGTAPPQIIGIFGVGYDVAEGQADQGGQPYQSVMDNLLTSGAIQRRSYSLYLNDPTSGQGNILFGGVDLAKFTAPVGLLPVVQNAAEPNAARLTVPLATMSFTIKGQPENLISIGDNGSGTAALLDSGSSAMSVDQATYAAILNGIGVPNDGQGFAWAPCPKDADYSGSFFTFYFGSDAGLPVSVSFDQFVGDPLPDSPDTNLNGVPSCQVMLDGTAPAGLFIMGDVFLSSAYVYFDLEESIIGLAQAVWGATDSNVIAAGPTSSGSDGQGGIPSASVVPNVVSVSYSIAPTDVGIGNIAQHTTVKGKASTPAATFKGVPTGGVAAKASGSKSAAPTFRPPPFEWAGVVVVCLSGLFSVLGASFMFV